MLGYQGPVNDPELGIAKNGIVRKLSKIRQLELTIKGVRFARSADSIPQFERTSLRVREGKYNDIFDFKLDAGANAAQCESAGRGWIACK